MEEVAGTAATQSVGAPAVAAVAPQVVGAPIVYQVPAQARRRVGKTRNPWGVWLLSVVTIGIYWLYWYYTINAEVRDYDERIQVQPGISLMAMLFGTFTLGIATIVSLVKTGGRIQQAQRAAGSNARCSGLVGLLLQMIGFGIVYYQSQLNKVWDEYGNPAPGTSV